MDDPQISQHTPARSDALAPAQPAPGGWARWWRRVVRALAGRG